MNVLMNGHSCVVYSTAQNSYDNLPSYSRIFTAEMLSIGEMGI